VILSRIFDYLTMNANTQCFVIADKFCHFGDEFSRKISIDDAERIHRVMIHVIMFLLLVSYFLSYSYSSIIVVFIRNN